MPAAMHMREAPWPPTALHCCTHRLPRSPYQNHFKLVSEAMQTLSWVAYTGPNCGAYTMSS